MSSFVYHPSGALYLPGAKSVIVADLHLGYGLAQRRRGQLGPIADTKTAQKLDSVLDELLPKKLILLGDAVHAPRPGEFERRWIGEQLQLWKDRTSPIFVRGNHDRRIGDDFGIDTIERLDLDALICIHGDGPIPVPAPEQIVVMGHLHPAVGISDAAGVRQRFPVFLRGPQVLVLPAFSPFAAGVDVNRKFPDVLRIFGDREYFSVAAATGRRVVELGQMARIALPAAGSRPADFRGN